MDTEKTTDLSLEMATRPENFFNRELSLLEFNRRVLAQARDARVPLLERLKYLCISCSNLDEFFEVRVSGLLQKQSAGASTGGPDNKSATELLGEISQRAHEIVDEQYRVLNEVLIPRLAAERIRFLRRRHFTIDPVMDAWLRQYFQNELLPILSPIGLDPAHPFPRVLNKSLNFIVSLEGKDAFGRSANLAVVQAPRALPRLIQIPPEHCRGNPHDFVFLSSVIHAYVSELFPGMDVTGCYQFRVTRNSDLFVDEEDVEDLLMALEGELLGRQFGDAVRLEVAHNCPESTLNYLLQVHGLKREQLYQVNGPVNLNRLMKLSDMIDRPDLCFEPFTPRVPASLAGGSDIFAAIRRGDILLHHPYESFVPVVDFLRQAAKDPGVLAIKQTLYRTGANSAVVDALLQAARAGKEVTVVIELRARFDEAENIDLAEQLQEAGAHVVYGVVGHKTHAKMALIVRREKEGLRNYVHMGTGNYHARTSRLYTDYGLLTCDEAIGRDVHRVFLQLTSLGKLAKLEKLLHSPFTLHRGLIERVEREIENLRDGKPARIMLKLNQLVERDSIAALYRASQAGVRIDLVVRGMTCLRPQVPGLSENIRLVSVVGRFLEHTRVYYFENGGEPEVWCSSADWMERNFFRRVEIAFPLTERKLKERVIRELKLYVADESQAWEGQPDGGYVRVKARPGRRKIRAAQNRLLNARR